MHQLGQLARMDLARLFVVAVAFGQQYFMQFFSPHVFCQSLSATLLALFSLSLFLLFALIFH